MLEDALDIVVNVDVEANVSPRGMFDAILVPSTSDDLGVFYLFWILAFLLIHILWDAYTKETPNFHLKRLEQKTVVLFSAATFASSLIILLSLISLQVRELLSDNSLPLVLAGLAGILLSIPSLCPYELPESLGGRAKPILPPGE